MTIQFDFLTANRILFRRKAFAELGKITSEFGTRALVVLGRSHRFGEEARQLLHSNGVEASIFTARDEPTVDEVSAGIQQAREFDANVVLAIGGGSAIDLGKAIAGLLTNDGSIYEYMEGAGPVKKFTQPSMPFVVVPTTSGTGSEVTRNAVITNEKRRVKVSLRSAYLLPRVAVVDPELMVSLPKTVTAFSGMDALTQLVEPFLSRFANPMTDMVSREGIRCVAKSLRKAFMIPDDLEAREQMAFASLLSGIALTNAGLGVVHGFSGVLGGMSGAHHGALCASMLAAGLEVNYRALLARDPSNPVIQRFKELASLLTQNDRTDAESTFQWVRETQALLNIPNLRELGVREADHDRAIEIAKNASSMKGNPIALTDEELLEILEKASR